MKKILFTDLDGTLLNNYSQIDEEMKKALKDMTDAGHYLALSSGRPLDSILEVKDLAGIEDTNAFIVASNGSLIYNCSTKEIIHEQRVSYDDVSTVWNLAKEHGLHVQTYTEDSVISAKEDDEIIFYRRRVHLPLILSDNPLDILQTPPLKLLIINLEDHERLEKMQAFITTQYSDRLQTVFSNPFYLEVFSKEAGKGNGLRNLCKHLNIPLESSFAAGDAQNDLSMLQAAGKAVVMCNADEELKKEADIITRRSNNDSGLADVIYEYILQ